MKFKPNDLILFTGDSITDCGRDRGDPASLGNGYVHLVARHLNEKHADLNLRIRNTGISGDRTCDLLARWERDCIAIQPDWVSILIGVNNAWRSFDSNDPTPISSFEAECRELLLHVHRDTKARLILCSPFLLHVDRAVVKMREELDPMIAVLKSLAQEFDALWIDFDAAFAAAQQRHIPSYWADDGVHPTPAGHALMAETWVALL